MSARLLDAFLAAGWRPAVCGDVMRADQHASVSLRITRGRLEVADAEGDPETVVGWVLRASALFLASLESTGQESTLKGSSTSSPIDATGRSR